MPGSATAALLTSTTSPETGDEELRDRLDRLDRAELLVGVVHVPDLGQLEVDDLAELLLGVIGDADRSDVAVDADPLVALRRSAGRPGFTRSPPSSSCRTASATTRAAAVAAADLDVELGPDRRGGRRAAARGRSACRASANACRT